MKLSRKLIVTAALAALPFAALAQTTGNMYDRNVEQQNRIEQGLRTGDLNVQEASRLERQEAGVSRMESRALRDGTLSDAERARINGAQDRVSQNIARERQDGDRGDPNSPSSRRMQADVQRNLNQQERVDQGVRSGQLTNREAGRLENGQARTERMEGRAGADGRIGANEQRRIQGADYRQGRQIYNERHDGQFRNGGDHRQAYGYGRDGRDNRQGFGNGHNGQFRQGDGYRRDADFRRDGDHRPSQSHWNNGRADGHQPQVGSSQPHVASPQSRTFQQHSYAQAGGGRRGR